MYQNDDNRHAALEAVYRRLSHDVDRLTFAVPVAAVYNPLAYAWPIFAEYLRRYASQGQVVMIGMNPGPWGMAQTGVPFGEIAAVRDWMGLEGPVGKPVSEHPKRPVDGLKCERSEVSGRRVWGWARARFGTPERFFNRFLILNYCPLLLLEESGRNRTPDRLPVAEKGPLLERCDVALGEALQILEPPHVIGIGKFATERCRRVLADSRIEVGSVLHPSPASPAANRGWSEQAERQLRQQGVALGL